MLSDATQIQRINNDQWRKGMIKGMWNANNPQSPEWPNAEDSDWYTVDGYAFGYNDPERARALLDIYAEMEEWS